MLSSESKKKTKKSSKMMRRRERGEVLEAPEIPFDLQIEIVNRLPIKSLARFKCVSKLWSSLICSKCYLFPSPPRLFISFVSYDPGSIESVLLSLASTSENTAFDLDIIKEWIGKVRNMVVLRGFILYQTFCCKQACIYNPTTGQRITLPAIKFNMAKETGHERFEYFFGYDPVLDQYKVVCTVVWSQKYTEHWVYVLEAESFWKRIEFDRPHLPYCQGPQGLCINGVIYYLAFRQSSGNIVAIFDVRSEKLNTITLPNALPMMANYIDLIEYGGKPTIYYGRKFFYPSTLFNLWILEDTGKWSKKSFEMHSVPPSLQFKVIGSTQNGEVVLQPYGFPSYILYYDLDKNDVKRIDIRGIPEDSKAPFRLVLMDTGVSIKYLKIENLNALLLIFLLRKLFRPLIKQNV